jgi:hypothetical protein
MKDLFKLGWIGCLGAALLVGCESMKGDQEDDDAGENESTEAVIQQSDVPAAVSDGFKKAHPSATVNKVEKETYTDGTIHYEYEYTENGKKGEVELSADGEVLDKH